MTARSDTRQRNLEQRLEELELRLEATENWIDSVDSAVVLPEKIILMPPIDPRMELSVEEFYRDRTKDN